MLINPCWTSGGLPATEREPSREPFSTDVQPHRAFASGQSISLTWCLALSSNTVPQRDPPSHQGDPGSGCVRDNERQLAARDDTIRSPLDVMFA